MEYSLNWLKLEYFNKVYKEKYMHESCLLVIVLWTITSTVICGMRFQETRLSFRPAFGYFNGFSRHLLVFGDHKCISSQVFSFIIELQQAGLTVQRPCLSKCRFRQGLSTKQILIQILIFLNFLSLLMSIEIRCLMNCLLNRWSWFV